MLKKLMINLRKRGEKKEYEGKQLKSQGKENKSTLFAQDFLPGSNITRNLKQQWSATNPREKQWNVCGGSIRSI